MTARRVTMGQLESAASAMTDAATRAGVDTRGWHLRAGMGGDSRTIGVYAYTRPGDPTSGVRSVYALTFDGSMRDALTTLDGMRAAFRLVTVPVR